jgi:hypothetical protein
VSCERASAEQVGLFFWFKIHPFISGSVFIFRVSLPAHSFTNFTIRSRAWKMELQHFSDRHPLIFNEDPPPRIHGYIDICSGCWEKVSGPHYSCEKCSWFIHKSCAELPRELRHPLHPKHPLLLIDAEFENPGVKCENCNRSTARGFIYSCVDCNFNLDRRCASLPVTIQAETHDHPLTLMRRSVSFTCDACGKEGKGMFYSCGPCGFWVHLECASFPLTVKHIRHSHPVNLITNSLEVHQSDHRLCQLCVKIVDIDYMFYYCSTCDYVNHLQCATNKRLLDETFVPDSEDTELGPPYVVLKSKVGEGKIEKAVEIKHFSHVHDLELIDKQLENKEKCDACVSPISLPFYSCAQCRFSLHKSCVELLRKKSHPLHRHTLILLPEVPSVRRFDCDACDRSCNGFTYRCDKCNFNLDVYCSLLPDIINHDGHEHQLILNSASYSDKCSSCDSKRKGLMFRCADCEFTLDFKCATLPRTIKYGPYEQLFVLCYKDEDSSSDEYFCDICEEERDPKHWFYYCADLNFLAHPDCILGIRSYIKSARHEHSLYLADKSEDANRLCDECGSLCYGLTYKCINCDFNLHRWCIYKTTEQTRLAKFGRHEHPLKLFDKGEGVHRQCDNCGYLCYGSSYGCINCDFSLHRWCIDKTTYRANKPG